MSQDLWAVQTAIHDVLGGDAGVQAVLGVPTRLYDQVPPDPIFPYACYGELTAAPYDTADRQGLDQTLSIHIYSRYRGRKELKDILAALYDALHLKSFSVSGAAFLDCRFLSAATLLADDGVTQQGIARFRILSQTP